MTNKFQLSHFVQWSLKYNHKFSWYVIDQLKKIDESQTFFSYDANLTLKTISCMQKRRENTNFPSTNINQRSLKFFFVPSPFFSFLFFFAFFLLFSFFDQPCNMSRNIFSRRTRAREKANFFFTNLHDSISFSCSLASRVQ